MSLPMTARGSWRDRSGLLRQRAQALADFEEAMPAKRRAALLAVLVAVFFLLTAASLVHAAAAAAACAVLLLAVTLSFPRTGLLLVVACVPVQSVFGLSRAQMQVVLAVGLLGIAIRHIHLLRRLVSGTPPTIIRMFAAFVLMFAARALLQLPDSSIDQMAVIGKEGVFYASLLIAALTSYYYADNPRFQVGLMQSVSLALALTILLDAISTYRPDWNEVLRLSKVWPELRFAGLHINPNATAKYLLLGVALACCGVWTARKRHARIAALAALAVATLALSATFSKSALLAGFGSLVIYLLHAAWQKEWRLSKSIFTTIALMSGISATWHIALFPLEREAAIERYAEARAIAGRLPGVSQTEESVVTQLQQELRTSESYAMEVEKPAAGSRPNSEMYLNIPGKITYTRRDCGWTCTGQRDRLWGGGLDVVRDHWFLGIGAAQWPREFQARLRFPFDSPHNGLLELWGGYGLAGLALYILLVLHLLRLVARSFRLSVQTTDGVFSVSTALFVLAILLTELFDPAKFLAMSPHTVWLWIFVAALSKTLETFNSAPATIQPQPASEIGPSTR